MLGLKTPNPQPLASTNAAHDSVAEKIPGTQGGPLAFLKSVRAPDVQGWSPVYDTRRYLRHNHGKAPCNPIKDWMPTVRRCCRRLAVLARTPHSPHGRCGCFGGRCGPRGRCRRDAAFARRHIRMTHFYTPTATAGRRRAGLCRCAPKIRFDRGCHQRLQHQWGSRATLDPKELRHHIPQDRKRKDPHRNSTGPPSPCHDS
mmetsp:Transcript_4468/g.10843  ORF Transcript_4468/g.10843 Transcript_4468/m.10843 type:complete len:201 (-) Transcript_4468:267-869(-)